MSFMGSLIPTNFILTIFRGKHNSHIPMMTMGIQAGWCGCAKQILLGIKYTILRIPIINSTRNRNCKIPLNQ